MDAMKYGWFGRTVALARHNVSGFRKAYVRPTRKEKKIIVESFMRNYQQLNGGRFPLPTITHREVGGSYYIVREIVREIINENRILDPCDISPIDHKMEELLQDRPLGTVSVHPQMEHNRTRVVSHQFETEKIEKSLQSVATINGERDNMFINNCQPRKIEPLEKSMGNFRSPIDMLTEITTTGVVTEVSSPRNRINPTANFGVKPEIEKISYEENPVSAIETTLFKHDEGKAKFQDQYPNIKYDMVDEKKKLDSNIAAPGHLNISEHCVLNPRDFLDPEEVEHVPVNCQNPPRNEFFEQKVTQNDIDTTATKHLSSSDDHNNRNSLEEVVSPDRSNMDGAAKEHSDVEEGNSVLGFLRNMVASFKFWSQR